MQQNDSLADGYRVYSTTSAYRSIVAAASSPSQALYGFRVAAGSSGQWPHTIARSPAARQAASVVANHSCCSSLSAPLFTKVPADPLHAGGSSRQPPPLRRFGLHLASASRYKLSRPRSRCRVQSRATRPPHRPSNTTLSRRHPSGTCRRCSAAAPHVAAGAAAPGHDCRPRGTAAMRV